MSGDDLITAIVQAPTDALAGDVARRAPMRVVMDAADTLYVDTYGHGCAYIRAALVTEARS